MKMNFKKHTALAISSLFLGTAAIIYAAAPNGGYLPGQTLEPDCNPGDANCFINIETPIGSIYGDVKYGMQSGDHEGWIKLDGRAKNSLNPLQQSNATNLGIGANLPNANNSYFVQNSGTPGSISGSNTKTIERNQLPNFTLGGSTNTAGEHNHPVRVTTAGGWPAGMPNSFKKDMNGFDKEANVSTSDRTSQSEYANTGIIGNAGNHSHTITTNSINGGVTQQTFNVQPQSLSLNAFIYLGE